MEDRPLLASAPAHRPTDVYRCPGESYAIDRAVHLGRLASFYPACRTCIHRDDTHTLSPLELEHWAEVGRRGHQRPRFTAESLLAKSPNAMSGAVARQFAGALGIALWRDRLNQPRPPAVLVGADGHWSTAELVSAVCEALQLAGCRAIEIGAVTSAALAVGVSHFQTDAALWVGNASGEPHVKELKVWGPAGLPWSSPGHFERIRELYEAKLDRPKRRGGGLERVQISDHYLAPFRSMFHALRPLRLVVDTTCQPLLGYLDQLMSQAACEVLPTGPVAGLANPADAAKPFVDRRLAAVGRQIVAAGGDIGLWIRGDAEACRVVDERGIPVEGDRLLALLAATICRQQPDATIVLDRDAPGELELQLGRLGARTLRSGATRQAMSEAIQASGAVLGTGAGGRIWFSGQPSAPDALLTISLLLTILSESDRPVSEVLDAV